MNYRDDKPKYPRNDLMLLLPPCGAYNPPFQQKKKIHMTLFFPPATVGLLRLQKGGEFKKTPQPLRPAGVPQDEHLI